MQTLRNFDYIVVGAGSAGCVVAARLTEDSSKNVLLIEAGGWDWHPLISVPIGIGVLHRTGHHDWGFSAERDQGISGRVLKAQRGKGVGGSHAINVMGFTRGHSEDYDRWEREGATGWNYSSCLPYFKKLEHWEGGASAYRGSSGPLHVQSATSQDPIFGALEQAAANSGFPATDDFNGQDPIGFGDMQFTIKNGHRHSTARAYLYPARKRPNLKILTSAQVVRILFDGRKATGVVYRKGTEDCRALAGKEIILCAGAYMTPNLLQRSGIGPADALSKHGITVQNDLPVGENLQDHLGIWYDYERQGPSPFKNLLRFDKMAPSFLAAWLLGKGPASVLPGKTFGFLRLFEDSISPDVEIMFRPTSATAHLWFPGVRAPAPDRMAIRPTILHPKSRGRVSLRDTGTTSAPLIQNHFLEDPYDLATLRMASRLSFDLMRRPELASYVGEQKRPFEGLDDAELHEWIRQNVATANHPCGTCAIGRVVDPQLKVIGYDNLRVVDAAAMPSLVSGHINAAVIMMAERASDMIKGAA